MITVKNFRTPLLMLLAGILVISFRPSIAQTNQSQRKAAKRTDITLKDGESYSLYQLDMSFIPQHDSESDGYAGYLSSKVLFDPATLTFAKSAVIRSFDTQQNNGNDLIAYANSIAANRGLGYTNTLAESGTVSFSFYAFMGENISPEKDMNFGPYIHTLFQSKTARTILFDEALRIVKGYCKWVPGDFRRAVLKEIDRLIQFTKTLPTKTYSESEYFEDYWMGFLYRRHLVDKVPVTEIQAQLTKARTELSALQIDTDYTHEIRVNQDISVFWTPQQAILISNLTKKEFTVEDKRLTEIKLLMDNNKPHYLFTFMGASGESKKMLFDSRMTLIE